jgi:hypothetical protein
VLVVGLDPEIPSAWDFTPRGSESLPPYPHDLKRPRGGIIWDLEALVRVPAGLLAVLIGVAGLSGDRARGWLEALRTLPIPPWHVSLARLTGVSFAVLWIVLAWWTGVSLVGSPARVGGQFSKLAGPSAAYLLLLCACGLACGWLIKSRVRAFGAALAVWGAIGVVLPTGVPALLELLSPVGDEAAFERARRERYSDAMRALELRIGGALAPHLPATHVLAADLSEPAERAFGLVEDEWKQGLIEARMMARDFDMDWTARRTRRESHLKLNTLAVPGVLFGDVMSGLAGTGRAWADSWREAIAHRQAYLNAVLFDDRPAASVRVTIRGQPNSFVLRRRPDVRISDLSSFEPGPTNDTGGAAVSSMIAGLLWLVSAMAAAQGAGVFAIRTGRTERVD